MITATIVQRVWNYCNTLIDDGVSYRDYVEQLIHCILRNDFSLLQSK